MNAPREGTPRQSGGHDRRKFRTRILAFLLVAVLLTLIFRLFDADATARALVRWVDAWGWWAVPVFIALHTLAVVLLLPGAIFPLMAGFLFGPVGGSVYSALGKTLGAVAAFCIARYLIGGHRRSEWLRRARERHPTLAEAEQAIVDGGWRTLAGIRLIPAIPFKISSYLFGWSKLPLREFALGTLIGTIPYSITNAYLGSLAGSLSALGATPFPKTPQGWTIYGGAVAVAIGAAAWAVLRTRRLLRDVQANRPATGRADEAAH